MEENNFNERYDTAFKLLLECEKTFEELLCDLLRKWFVSEKKENNIRIIDSAITFGLYGDLYRVEKLIFEPLGYCSTYGDDIFHHFTCELEIIAENKRNGYHPKNLPIRDCISLNPYNALKLCREVYTALETLTMDCKTTKK